MIREVSGLWVYLAATPLLWLTTTLVAYFVADMLAGLIHRPAWAHPVLISMLMLVGLLRATGTDYETYFRGAQFVNFLLGPATVALALPLVREARRVRRVIWPLAGALLAGSLTAIISAVGIAWLLGAGPITLASMAPKSVTTPIAMAVAQRIGGVPALTAALVVLTGIFGAATMTPLFRLLGMRDEAAKGLAAGVAAHGMGTAQAFQSSELAGTFAGLGLALNGLLTSILVPLLAGLLK